MRKTTAVLSALALSALALTGCSASQPSYAGSVCDRDSSDALAAKVDVSGELGDPAVHLESPVRTAKVTYADLIIGDGARIKAADQFAIFTRVLVNGKTGETIDSAVSFWSPELADQQFAGVDKALGCATDGSRIVVALPQSSLPEGAADQLGLSGSDSIVAVYDVRAVMLPKAEGRDVFNAASGLPSVVRTADGHPGVIIPDAKAPTKPVTQTLIAGDGEKVGDGSAVIKSLAVDWKTRDVTETSWDKGVADAGALPEQAQAALRKATIGSQLMVIVPGEKGDATVHVIDVLGVIPAELTQR